IDFESMDQKPSKLFVLVVSPKKTSAPHLQLLSSLASILNKDAIVEDIISSESSQVLIDKLTLLSKNIH
ncbi:MAG: PTS sugar transporter subunit IIA, partial [Spirochaetaceae bacterium]|nr:PTS sugar transporter subunit IIA [Spirochaetaceae bacterium]